MMITSRRTITHFDAAGNSVVFIDGREAVDDPIVLLRGVVHALRNTRYDPPPDIFALLYHRSDNLTMSFLNPDMTAEAVCGNALRCVPHVLSDEDNTMQTHTTIHTSHAPFLVYLDGDGNSCFEVAREHIIHQAYGADSLVDLGTPHRVRQLDTIDSLVCEHLGQCWSTMANPVNATFVQVSDSRLFVRTFERGVGETRSCGTGALAACIHWMDMANLEPQLLSKPVHTEVCFRSGERLTVSYSKLKDSFTVSGSCKKLRKLVI